MKLTKRVAKEYYQVEPIGKTHRYTNRDNAINKALDLAVGAPRDIKIFKVVVTVWETEDYLSRGIVREVATKELALLVAARPVRGTGGWIDYEE